MSLAARSRTATVVWWAAAGAVVVAAVAAQIARPIAPDLGGLPPAERFFDADFVAQAARYRTPRAWVGLLRLGMVLGVAATAALLPAGRRMGARLVERLAPRRPGLATALLLLALLLAIDLATLPLDFWAGFVHEGRYGFRTQGAAGWARDWLVARTPAWLAALLLAPLALRTVRRLPRLWPPVLGLAGGLLAAVLTMAAPVLLEPLWLRTTPLPDGPVRVEVERVLERSGLSADRILVGDASRRSTKANAYVSGLGGTRRIVLYDTLLREASPDEVGAVVAHELAHHAHADLPRGVLLAAGGSVLLAVGVWVGLRWGARRGLAPEQPGPLSVPLALLLTLALSILSLPAQSFVSRRAEAAADWGALQLTGDPETYARMQLALARSHLADPAPPEWVRLLWYTHPPVTARLELARWWRQEQE